MNLDYFRRNTKKVLAVLAIVSLFAFTIGDSLVNMVYNRGRNVNVVEVKLFGKDVWSADLQRVANERNLANSFVETLTRLRVGFPQSNVFGGLSKRELVDALILENEADRVGIPRSRELAEDFLRTRLGLDIKDPNDNALMAEALRSGFRNVATSNMILQAIANQYRLRLVMELGVTANVTPLDVLQGFRDRNERVSANFVEIPVADFLAEVPSNPPESELRALYEKHKNQLPDPQSPDPGFKIPRRTRVAFVTLDVASLRRSIKDELLANEDELRDYFTVRKRALVEERQRRAREDLDFQGYPATLPLDVFQGDPDAELTPLTFDMVKNELADELARERADAIANERLGAVETNVVNRFLQAYDDAVAEYEDSRGGDRERLGPEALDPENLRSRGLDKSLKALADEWGVPYDPKTPVNDVLVAAIAKAAADAGLEYDPGQLLPRSRLAELGPVVNAVNGFEYRIETARDPSQTFPELAFEENSRLYDNFKLVDPEGRRYLGWRVEDRPEEVPPFDVVKSEVVAAWRTNRARELAKKRADEIAAKAREANGALSEAAGGLPVRSMLPATRLVESFANLSSPFAPPTFEPRPLPEFVNPGDDLREAVFEKLAKPGDVVVAPNQTADRYYVLAHHLREPVPFDAFVSNANKRETDDIRFALEQEAMFANLESWMADMRKRAGLPEDWRPVEDDARR